MFALIFFVSLVAIITFGDINALPEDYLALLKPQYVFVGALISFASAAYFSLYRKNIRVEVSDEGVRFFRGGNEYLFFSAEEFEFTSFVVRNNVNGIPAGTTKFLRVIEKFSGKEKDYALQGFGKEAFEEIISCATDLNSNEKKIPAPKISDSAEFFEYNIDADLLVKKIKRDIKPWFLPIGFTVGAVYVGFVYNDSGGVISAVALLFFSIIFIITTKINLQCYAKLVPQKICIYADKISVDEKVFYFEKISMIKATPPSYNEAKWELLMLKRKLIIVEDGKVFTYIVGAVADRGAVAAFEDYEDFCEKLKLSCDKFCFDLV
jgi:hypothetical protein